MATAPLPPTTVAVLDQTGQFTIPWRRWFQALPGGGSVSSGLPGPPGPSGPAGPEGPAGADSDTLGLLGISAFDGGGFGTVTSVGLAAPAEFVVSGSPVTSAGTLTLTKANENANLVWAGPTTGAAAQPTFRSLVGADLPNPSATTLGGIESAAPVSHEWINSISTAGVPALSQPAFTDISGVAAPAQLPTPTASTLGGVESLAAVASKWINQISTAGVPSATQPAATDLSDFVARTTFTPTITFATPGNLSVAYTSQQGAYVKVGPLILFWYTLGFTPTYTTASGNFQVSAPPLAITDLANWAWPIRSFSSVTWPTGTTIIARPNTGPVILISTNASGGATNNFTTTQIVSGTAYGLVFSGFYF